MYCSMYFPYSYSSPLLVCNLSQCQEPHRRCLSVSSVGFSDRTAIQQFILRVQEGRNETSRAISTIVLYGWFFSAAPSSSKHSRNSRLMWILTNDFLLEVLIWPLGIWFQKSWKCVSDGQELTSSVITDMITLVLVINDSVPISLSFSNT